MTAGSGLVHAEFSPHYFSDADIQPYVDKRLRFVG